MEAVEEAHASTPLFPLGRKALPTVTRAAKVQGLGQDAMGDGRSKETAQAQIDRVLLKGWKIPVTGDPSKIQGRIVSWERGWKSLRKPTPYPERKGLPNNETE